MGDKGGGYVRADKLTTFICLNLEIWEPQTLGHLDVCPDFALPFANFKYSQIILWYFFQYYLI